MKKVFIKQEDQETECCLSFQVPTSVSQRTSEYQLIEGDMVVPMRVPGDGSLQRLVDMLYHKRKVTTKILRKGTFHSVHLARLKPNMDVSSDCMIANSPMNQEFRDHTQVISQLIRINMKQRESDVATLLKNVRRQQLYQESSITMYCDHFKQLLHDTLNRSPSPHVKAQVFSINYNLNMITCRQIIYSQPLLEIYHGYTQPDLFQHTPVMTAAECYQDETIFSVRKRVDPALKETVFSGNLLTLEGFSLPFVQDRSYLVLPPNKLHYRKVVWFTYYYFEEKDLMRLAEFRRERLQSGRRMDIEQAPLPTCVSQFFKPKLHKMAKVQPFT